MDWSPLEKAQQLAARSASQLVPAVVEQLGLEQKRAETEIAKAWQSLLDPTLTAHAQPTGLRRGTLFVSVDSSVWLTEIVRYRQKEILERLRLSFGSNLIKKISFRIG
jgi:predicted nucleic acid-binding Zn ribbon protein